MKTNLHQLCAISFFVLLSSCMKMDMPDKKVQQETQTITIELLKNDTYHYTIPQSQSDNDYLISKQAEHFSTSELGMNYIYTYTPALNYVGVDKVTITNAVEQTNSQGNYCGNQQGNNNNGCGGNQNETERTITIHFIIKEKEQGKLHKSVTICPVF